MLLLLSLLTFTTALPMEMPRAEAYLVRDHGKYRLEDRYVTLDLWTANAVTGRWLDEDGNLLLTAELVVIPPKFPEASKTRTDYYADCVRLHYQKDLDLRDQAIGLLSPLPLPEHPAKPKQLPHGFRSVLFYQGTNTNTVVCAYLPEKARRWGLVIVEGMTQERFLDTLFEPVTEHQRHPAEAPLSTKRRPSERELLKRDVAHSVESYEDWRFTASEEFCVIDNLGASERFIPVLTNDLARMRRHYAEVVPSPIDGTNVLSVARIFRTREEYLDAVGEDYQWTAALWSPTRRELVAYLPPDGERKLLRTIRHEAFHQYLSYACSMIAASPWLNEGYAEYFEHWEADLDYASAPSVPEELKAFAGASDEELQAYAAQLLPLMMMDYEEFYSGTPEARQLKYQLAHSLAYFLENGAPKVRFRPFQSVKQRYLESLLKTKDMRAATLDAFETREKSELLLREWRKFWKNP